MSPTVWTRRRQWLGNLVPIALGSPWMVAGLTLTVLQGDFLGLGLYFLVTGLAVTWVSLNAFGFWGSRAMEQQLSALLIQRGVNLPAERWFVGICTPRHRGLLDAHEDVGYLFIEGNALVFQGEFRRIELERAGLLAPKFRPNVHSFVLLGRWILIEGVQGATRVRLAIEPRVRRSMLGNLLAGPRLKQWVTLWVQSPETPILPKTQPKSLD